MLDWTSIVAKFESTFQETFTADRKAHFDNLPPELHIVDGAKIQWCNLLLLDAIIFIIKNDGFSHSIRRAFNQSLILYQCIMKELQTADLNSYSIIMEEKKALIELGGEQNSEVMSFHLTISDPKWQSMAQLESYLISETPASKAKLKFPVVVKLLTSHEAFSTFGFDLPAILRAVVFKVLFKFNPGKAKSIIVAKKTAGDLSSKKKKCATKKPSITEALQEYHQQQQQQQQKAAAEQIEGAIIIGQDYPASPTTDEFLFDGFSDCLLGCGSGDDDGGGGYYPQRDPDGSSEPSSPAMSSITGASPIGTQGTLTPPSPSRRKRCALSVDLSIPPSCEGTNNSNRSSNTHSNTTGVGRAKGPLERVKQTKQRLFSPKCYSEAVAAIKAQAGSAVGAPAGRQPVSVVTVPHIVSDASVPVVDMAVVNSPAHTLGSTVGSTSSEATDNVSTVDGVDELGGMTFDQADFDLLLADFADGGQAEGGVYDGRGDGDGMMEMAEHISANQKSVQTQQQKDLMASPSPSDVILHRAFGSSCSLCCGHDVDTTTTAPRTPVVNGISDKNQWHEQQLQQHYQQHEEASDPLFFAQDDEEDEECMFEWLYPVMMED